VVLELDRQTIPVRLEIGYRMLAPPIGPPLEFDVILDQNAIVKNSERRFFHDLFAFENRTMENDVVRLPLARSPARIDQRDGSAV
jgi:hypothetical protein